MKTGSYKGKRYRVEFVGKTTHGDRAKLAFMDGSKEFWVDAKLVTDIKEETNPPVRRPNVSAGCWECPACGEENDASSPSCWECGCGRSR